MSHHVDKRGGAVNDWQPSAAAGEKIRRLRFKKLNGEQTRFEPLPGPVGTDYPAVGKGAGGALPDLLGVALFAFIAMGLLAVGFKNKPLEERTENPPLLGQQTR